MNLLDDLETIMHKTSPMSEDMLVFCNARAYLRMEPGGRLPVDCYMPLYQVENELNDIQREAKYRLGKEVFSNLKTKYELVISTMELVTKELSRAEYQDLSSVRGVRVP